MEKDWNELTDKEFSAMIEQEHLSKVPHIGMCAALVIVVMLAAVWS